MVCAKAGRDQLELVVGLFQRLFGRVELVGEVLLEGLPCFELLLHLPELFRPGLRLKQAKGQHARWWRTAW